MIKILSALIRCKHLKIQNQILFYCSNNQNQKEQTFSFIKQFLDSDHIIQQKVQQLTHYIQKAKHPIFFTGAGISTSVGIPDYRSYANTVVSTGPGLWNRSEEELNNNHEKKKAIQNLVDLATPSITHMAIFTLIQKNIFKYLVSQNTDGLHLRSGVKKSFLSQLHGNRNLQQCKKCQKKYLRDFRTLKASQKRFKPGQIREHFTGRNCQNCNGELYDSIIYFGQKLPKQQLIKAYQEAAKSDLCLVIGSSLTVKPSSNIPLFPLKYNPEGKMIIVNIQQTPLDNNSNLRINGFCDQVMIRLMKNLNLKILPFTIIHYFQLNIQQALTYIKIQIFEKDEHYDNFTFIKKASVYTDEACLREIYENKPQNQNNKKINFSFYLSKEQKQGQIIKNYILIQFYGNKPCFKLYLKDFLNGKRQIKFKITSKSNSPWKLQIL